MKADGLLRALRSKASTLLRNLAAFLPNLDDPLFVDYLLNTFVNKIPFPDVRMALYRQAGLNVDVTSNIMMYGFVLNARNYDRPQLHHRPVHHVGRSRDLEDRPQCKRRG